MSRGGEYVRFPFLNAFRLIRASTKEYTPCVDDLSLYARLKQYCRCFFFAQYPASKLLWLEKLTGSVTAFSMEHRIFNGISLVTLAGLFMFMVFNIIAGLPGPALIMALVMLAQVYLYYLSRFKKQLATGVIAFAVISQLCLSANFYFNSGLHGPTLFGFFLTFQLVISVTPKKQHLLWLLVHIAVAAGLLILEYRRPDLVFYSYSSRKDQYLDMLLTYIGVLVSIFWISGYLKYSYESQRRLIKSQNRKLEKLNAEKNKIFSIVAHDLRSPLASIQGYLEMLMLLPEEAPDRNLQARLLNLTTNTTDMLANLLQWSKNQMEGESIYIREMNLYQLVARVLSVQDTLARGKQITIHSAIDPEHMVLADREMLALVIRNLINNAIKFSPPGSTIRLNSYINDGFVFLSIRDEGIGITPVQQEQLFSLNVASSYGTNNEKGTGLGLALCKEFIEKMQGSISYEKGKPDGSIFTIAIPPAVEEAVETAPPVPA